MHIIYIYLDIRYIHYLNLATRINLRWRTLSTRVFPEDKNGIQAAATRHRPDDLAASGQPPFQVEAGIYILSGIVFFPHSPFIENQFYTPSFLFFLFRGVCRKKMLLRDVFSSYFFLPNVHFHIPPGGLKGEIYIPS